MNSSTIATSDQFGTVCIEQNYFPFQVASKSRMSHQMCVQPIFKVQSSKESMSNHCSKAHSPYVFHGALAVQLYCPPAYIR